MTTTQSLMDALTFGPGVGRISQREWEELLKCWEPGNGGGFFGPLAQMRIFPRGANGDRDLQLNPAGFCGGDHKWAVGEDLLHVVLHSWRFRYLEAATAAQFEPWLISQGLALEDVYFSFYTPLRGSKFFSWYPPERMTWLER